MSYWSTQPNAPDCNAMPMERMMADCERHDHTYSCRDVIAHIYVIAGPEGFLKSTGYCIALLFRWKFLPPSSPPTLYREPP